MKKLCFVLIIFAVFYADSISHAQDGWYYQTPVWVRDVHFVNINKCVAVGQGVWISEDAGLSWKGVYPDFVLDGQAYLKSVHFPNSSHGYAVGTPGLLIKTVDGGSSWERIPLSLPYSNQLDLTSIYFLDNEIGFIGGMTYINSQVGYIGFILKTTDGGQNWQVQLEGDPIYSIDFSEGNIGWASGRSAHLYKSDVMGNNWSQVSIPVVPGHSSPNLLDVKFTDDNHGIISIGSFDYVLRTEDGGGEWQIVETGFSANYRYDKIEYFSTGKVYTIAEGDFYESNDHGQNWNLIYDATEENNGVNGLPSYFSFASESVGISYAYSGILDATHFRTENGGAAWEGINWGGPRSLLFLNQNEGWASVNLPYSNYTGGVILKTTDGATWTHHQFEVPNLFKVYWIEKFQAINSDILFAKAYASPTANSYNDVLIKSDDGGISWTYEDFQTSRVNDVCFINETYGWIVTYSGAIYKTLDGAATWGPQTSGVSSELNAVDFVDENNGWIGGDGVFLFTNNGGLLWDTLGVSTINLDEIMDVEFVDSEVGYAAGHQIDPNSGQYIGKLLKTGDGGSTWNEITPAGFSFGFSDPQEYIKIDNSNNIYLFAHANNPPLSEILFKSVDGGNSWIAVDTPSDISGFDIVNSSRYVLAADGVAITTNGGVTDIDEKSISDPAVNNFFLKQNYPNPFNPSTTINYQIPEDGFVSLKVFDVLGREAAELVGEVKPAGNYNVEFDAGKLSSGIYFYKIQFNSFSSVKKMILVK